MTLFGDNGVIKKAQKAKEETDRTTIEEQEGLNRTEQDMVNAIKGNEPKENEWTQPDPLSTEITNGEITLKIGDYVDYSCENSTATYTSPASNSGHTVDQVFKANEYQYGWRVLGVDKNTKQLQLISEDFAQPTQGGKQSGVRQVYKLAGQNGYYKSFTYYDETRRTWKTLKENESVILKGSAYNYFPTTLSNGDDITATVGITSTSSEYKMLFTNSSTGADATNAGNTTNIKYWLGTSCVYTDEGRVNTGFLYIYEGRVHYNFIYHSNGVNNTSQCYGVRPVVTLSSRVILKDSGTMKDGCKLYNMSL